MADNTADLEQPYSNATKIRMTPVLEEEINKLILELYPAGLPDGLAIIPKDLLLPYMHRKPPPTGEVGRFCNDNPPTILVRGFEYNDKSADAGYKWYGPPRLVNFHKVDLKLSKLELNCYPSVLTNVKTGNSFGGSSKIYMVGRIPHGLFTSVPYADPPNKDTHHYHGASVLDTETNTWKGITLPVISPSVGNPICASFHNGDKLYQFGASFLMKPQSYNSSTDTWEDLTIFQKFRECHIQSKVLSDPINKRILFNISGHNLLTWGQLYAYYPDEPDREKQIQLVSVQVPWSNVVAVAKDVAYVRRPGDDILCAYDLSTWISKPLDVAWTSTMLRNTDGDDVDLNECGCNSLFYMGSDIFWMAFWFRTRETPCQTWLYFVKFIASRNEDKITCTPLDLQCYPLKSMHHIYDFLMIQPSSEE